MTAPEPHPPGTSRLEYFARIALVVLGVAVVGALLFFARSAFVPVAFSLLLALVLSSPVEFLRRLGVPRSVGAAALLILFVGLAAVAVDVLWVPARAWIAAIPHTIDTVEHKLGPASRVLRHLAASAGGPAQAPALARASSSEVAMSASETLIGETPSIVVNLVTIVMLTLFLVAGGAPMTARVAATLTSEGKSIKVLKVVDAVRTEVGRYYVTLALINLGLGVATATTMMVLGLPNPLLWGAMAAALNFIPYAGSAVTLAVLTLVSFVTFDGLGHVLAVAVSFLVLVTIEGQVVEPLLIGRQLKLSPIVVFLALWFGGWFWGIAGVILAIPALVTLKVVAEHSKNGLILVELLSPTPHKPHALLQLRSRAAGAAGAAGAAVGRRAGDPAAPAPSPKGDASVG